jgi:hypothetical protein
MTQGARHRQVRLLDQADDFELLGGRVPHARSSPAPIILLFRHHSSSACSAPTFFSDRLPRAAPRPRRSSPHGLCRLPAGASRLPGTPSTMRNTGARRCPLGGTAPRCCPRRVAPPERCGSCPRRSDACGSPGGCHERFARPAAWPGPHSTERRGRRISSSSALLGGYDEPGLLPSATTPLCLIGPDAGQWRTAYHLTCSLRPELVT